MGRVRSELSLQASILHPQPPSLQASAFIFQSFGAPNSRLQVSELELGARVWRLEAGGWRLELAAPSWRILLRGSGGFVACGRVGPSPLLAPKFGYLASSWRSCAPSCAILAHLGALGPHLVAKLLQDGAQLAQHSPTSRQDEPTWPPRAPPRTPKTLKNL